MTKDRIIQAVLRYLEGSAVSLIAECSDYEAARDVLDELEKIDKATEEKKWFLAVDHCHEIVASVPHHILLDSEDGELILTGAGE